jgi:membrane protease YdiL (CAAX protease family)
VVVNVILERPEQEITLDLYTTSVWPLLLWIAVVILGPIFEETLFRGFLFEGFRQSRVGATGAIIITSVVFASLHIQYDIYSMGQILFLGIILGIVRWKTGSLWGPLLIHSLNNLLAMVLVALTVNGTF